MFNRGVPFMIKCDGLPNNESKIVKPSLINPNNLGEQPKTSLVNEIVSKFNELPKLSNLVPKKEKTPLIKNEINEVAKIENNVVAKSENCQLANQADLLVGKLVKLDSK